MHFIRFATRLPFFLIAEATLWCAASFGSHLGLHRGSEALEQHRRLVDWLRGGSKGTQTQGRAILKASASTPRLDSCRNIAISPITGKSVGGVNARLRAEWVTSDCELGSDRLPFRLWNPLPSLCSSTTPFSCFGATNPMGEPPLMRYRRRCFGAWTERATSGHC